MYVSSFCKLMRINVFIFSQHGIRAIKEFENTRIRVSPCGQFRQSIQRPCHNPVVLQSSRSLTKAKPSSKYLTASNFYRQDFPATSTPVEEHTNRSASLLSTFRWKPHRKITSHAPISDNRFLSFQIVKKMRKGTDFQVYFLFLPTKEPLQLVKASFNILGKTQQTPTREKKFPKGANNWTMQQDMVYHLFYVATKKTSVR